MKILYILHTSDMGGSTISFLNLLRGIRKRGAEVIVAAPMLERTFIHAVEETGSKCVKVPIYFTAHAPMPDRLKQWYGYVVLAGLKVYSFWHILRLVLRENPDLIHTNTGVVHEGWLVARLLRKPHVWHLREYQDRDFGMHILPSKKCFSLELRAPYVVSITKDILKSFSIEEDAGHKVIYNGILPQDKVAMEFPKEKYFLCCSRVSPEKGHDEVIRSFALFYRQHPNYRLVILGEGPQKYKNELDHLVKELGCDDVVKFEGFQRDVTSYMRKAMALVVASHNEGFGRMTAEAAFCGCLVIGRNTSGTKEIMDKTGEIPFLTSDEMTQAMGRVATMNEEEYRAMALKAQKVAVSIYSIESNVEQIYQLYQQILKNRK